MKSARDNACTIVAMRFALLALSICAASGCAPNAAASPDASVPVDADATDANDCPDVIHPDVSQANVDGLTNALALWKWSKEIRQGTELDINACDATYAYRFGPSVFFSPSTPANYAACVLAQGAVIPSSSGALDRPDSCPTIVCPDKKYGLVWAANNTGKVFELNSEGRPRGQALFSVRPIGKDLLWSATDGSEDGFRMTAQVGNPIALQCR